MIKRYLKTSVGILIVISILTACKVDDAPKKTVAEDVTSETYTEANSSADSTDESIKPSEGTEESTDGDEPSEESTNGDLSTDEDTSEEVESKENDDNKQPDTQQSVDSGSLSKIVNGILDNIIEPGMSEVEKVLAIHDYLTYNVDYDYDNYLNDTIPYTSHTAVGALTTGWGVCDGYAYSFYALADAAGLEVTNVSGTAGDGAESTWQAHAWNQVKIAGTWYNIDVCWDDPTYKGKKASDHSGNMYAFCLITDSELRKTHKWDTAYAKKCSNAYDGTAFAKALAKVSKYVDVLCIEDINKADEVIKKAVDSGKKSFVIMEDNKNGDHYEEIKMALVKTKQPLWVQSQSISASTNIYRVEIKKGVICVETDEDFKEAIEANKGKLDELELWYYNDKMSSSDSAKWINEILCRLGYNAEVESMTDVFGGMVECHGIKMLNNVLRVDDLSDVLSYYKENGDSSIKNKEIWYITTDSDNFYNDILETFMNQGYYIYCEEKFANKINGAVKFYINEIEEVDYIKDEADLREYVESVGIKNIKGKKIYVKVAEAESPFDVVRDMFYQLQYAIMASTATGGGKFYEVELDGIYENVYVSLSLEDLKADINNAKSKGLLSSYDFYFPDKTRKYTEEDITAMIKEVAPDVYIGGVYYRTGDCYVISLY